jgi:hypothetical protein
VSLRPPSSKKSVYLNSTTNGPQISENATSFDLENSKISKNSNGNIVERNKRLVKEKSEKLKIGKHLVNLDLRTFNDVKKKA